MGSVISEAEGRPNGCGGRHFDEKPTHTRAPRGTCKLTLGDGPPFTAGNLKMGSDDRFSPRPQSSDRVGIFVTKSGGGVKKQAAGRIFGGGNQIPGETQKLFLKA